MAHLLLAVIYLSFISLGLPDSLLGSAWPVIYPQFGVPVSYAGILSMIIAVGTVISSLKSDCLTRKLGSGWVTAISVGTTALALYGFSTARAFWTLCLWAIPYGLGAGSVDASLNNYVALHYESRHMSWLHCMWGVGASLGPYIIGRALTSGRGWSAGYFSVALLQILLTAILIISLPLWKGRGRNGEGAGGRRSGAPLRLKQVLALPGVKAVVASFFFYCALEQTTGLWASSYLVLNKGLQEETAAQWASLFFLGITAGRALSGFLTLRLPDRQMVLLGQVVAGLGIAALLLPLGSASALAGLILIGLGCAPVYPCIIHATPELFGAERSQAIIGVEMAGAYAGTCLAPPLFGWIAGGLGASVLPLFLLAALGAMAIFYRRVGCRGAAARGD